jgi:hypothetical protein
MYTSILVTIVTCLLPAAFIFLVACRDLDAEIAELEDRGMDRMSGGYTRTELWQTAHLAMYAHLYDGGMYVSPAWVRKAERLGVDEESIRRHINAECR